MYVARSRQGTESLKTFEFRVRSTHGAPTRLLLGDGSRASAVLICCNSSVCFVVFSSVLFFIQFFDTDSRGGGSQTQPRTRRRTRHGGDEG
jgi:hypothetical protein